MTLKGQLSPIFRDAIMQSEYVVHKKLLNSLKGDEDCRYIFFGVEGPATTRKTLVIRQLAKLNPTHSFLESYKVFITLLGNIQDK